MDNIDDYQYNTLFSMPRHSSTAPLTIIKRDGSIVPFDASKISRAVEKAMRASGEYRDGAPERVAGAVTRKLVEHSGSDTAVVPTVEGVQDLVEAELMLQKFPASAKAYILYREQHATLRAQERHVSHEIKTLVTDSKKYFPNQLSEFIFYSTYSRWLEEKGRRETWVETIDRYVGFMRENLGNKLKKTEYEEIRAYMLEMKAMGSMRLLWSAGAPARATDLCVFKS